MILALEVVSLPVADDGRGQVRDLYLVTPDGAAARQQLLERGRAVSDIRHKDPVAAWTGGWAPGPDPGSRDFAGFVDPDGHTWTLQERR